VSLLRAAPACSLYRAGVVDRMVGGRPGGPQDGSIPRHGRCARRDGRDVQDVYFRDARNRHRSRADGSGTVSLLGVAGVLELLIGWVVADALATDPLLHARLKERVLARLALRGVFAGGAGRAREHDGENGERNREHDEPSL
jgi:hypothetical protein